MTTDTVKNGMEATREKLGETVESLASKADPADIKAQASATLDQARRRPVPVGGAIVAVLVLLAVLWLLRRNASGDGS